MSIGILRPSKSLTAVSLVAWMGTWWAGGPQMEKKDDFLQNLRRMPQAVTLDVPAELIKARVDPSDTCRN